MKKNHKRIALLKHSLYLSSVIKTNEPMEELLNLINTYENVHGGEICIRIYGDESGVVTKDHIDYCLDDSECLFTFDTADQLKQFLQS